MVMKVIDILYLRSKLQVCFAQNTERQIQEDEIQGSRQLV